MLIPSGNVRSAPAAHRIGRARRAPEIASGAAPEDAADLETEGGTDMTRVGKRSSAVISVLVLPLAALFAARAAEEPAPESATVAEEKVQEEVDERLAERRRAMMQEAQTALEETESALAALDEGRNQDALDALARATGKLELLVARDPELALAPIDVDVVTHDLYATPEAIRKARERAEELLEDGEVQEARALLSGLGSEIVISVTSLPLATYPDAIKAISPLIDQGEIDEAKTALSAALNTLVVSNHVTPLPVLRARHLLDEAQALLDQEETTQEQSERIDQLVAQAREQLEMAELLGYGEKSEHQQFREQIAELERRIAGDGEDTGGLFARLRGTLDGFGRSFLD